MSIEKDLAQSVHSGSEHKAKLRRTLLDHIQQAPSTHRMRRKLLPLLFAVPAAAVVVFAVLAVLPITQKNSPEYVQNTLKPLTAQQVFAQAAEMVPGDVLQPGQYYYIKMLRQAVIFSDKNNCYKSVDISEFYINKDDRPVKIVRYTQSGNLFQIDTITEDGMQRGDEFFYDQAVAETTKTSAECPPIQTYAHDDSKSLTEADIERMRNDPINQAVMALTQQTPTPRQQKQALWALRNAETWELTGNVTIAGYDKPVIQIRSTSKESQEVQFPSREEVRFYFDQQTKRYVGLQSGGTVDLILEQDTRPLKKNPEYKITTPIGQM